LLSLEGRVVLGEKYFHPVAEGRRASLRWLQEFRFAGQEAVKQNQPAITAEYENIYPLPAFTMTTTCSSWQN